MCPWPRLRAHNSVLKIYSKKSGPCVLRMGRSACRKVFSPRMVQEYTVGPANFRALCTRKPGAFLETGSLFPPLAAHRPFPPLGFPAHTLHPQGVCGIRRAAQPLTAALPFRRGEFTALSTVSKRTASQSFFSLFSDTCHTISAVLPRMASNAIWYLHIVTQSFIMTRYVTNHAARRRAKSLKLERMDNT